MAGAILAIASVGSAAGAFLYGSRSWPLGIAGQYKVAMLAMAVGLAALAPLEHLGWFCVVSLFAGVPMSTVLAAQSVLIAGIAPRQALAESFTWAATSLLTGVSLGIAAGGLMLERSPPGVALAAGALTTCFGLAIAMLGVRQVVPAR
jgi:predicted MFS family arabinose efflux permease